MRKTIKVSIVILIFFSIGCEKIEKFISTDHDRNINSLDEKIEELEQLSENLSTKSAEVKDLINSYSRDIVSFRKEILGIIKSSSERNDLVQYKLLNIQRCLAYKDKLREFYCQSMAAYQEIKYLLSNCYIDRKMVLVLNTREISNIMNKIDEVSKKYVQLSSPKYVLSITDKDLIPLDLIYKNVVIKNKI